MRDLPDEPEASLSLASSTTFSLIWKERSVAMMVLLIAGGADDEIRFRREDLARLSQLGITSISFVRDDQTVAVVFEGWRFDPSRSAEAAARAVGAEPGARSLHPVMQLAVAAAT